MAPETYHFALTKCARESLQTKRLFLTKKDSSCLPIFASSFPWRYANIYNSYGCPLDTDHSFLPANN